MKKTLIGLCAGMLMLAGCDWNEGVALVATQAAGKLAMTTWFAVDDPGVEVKSALKNAVGIIQSAEVEGATYKETLFPEIVKLVDTKYPELDDFKKQLIESGAIIVLGGIDQLFINNEKLASNRDLARKYISAFCAGVNAALVAAETDASIENSSKAYKMRINSMSRRRVK